MSVYGYCRKTQPREIIERQVKTIKKKYPEAKIVVEDRKDNSHKIKALEELLANVTPGDVIVFNKVRAISKMPDKVYEIIRQMIKKHVNFYFIDAPLINSDILLRINADEINNNLSSAGILIKEQIKSTVKYDNTIDRKLSYSEESLNEVTIVKPRNDSVRVEKIKEIIKKQSKFFNGSLPDNIVIQKLPIGRNAFYKYKKELFEELYGE